jgi:hypothetical protein
VSRVALGLLAAAVVAAALVSRLVSFVEWVAYVFLALFTAAILERRARGGAPIGRMGPAVAVLLGGAGGAAYGIAEELAPFALGAAFAAGAALLVTLWHEARRLLAFFRSRAAFYGITALVLSASVVCAVVAVNVLAARSPVQIDMTQARVHSLSAQTLELLAAVPGEVTLHAFFRKDEGVARARLGPLLERYRAASPRLRVAFHDPDREPRLVADLGVREDGPRLVAVSPLGSARVLPSGRGVTVLDTRNPARMIHFREFTEADITNGIVRATRPRPRVCFLTGHGEAALGEEGPAGLAGLRRALEDHNLEPWPLSLAAKAEVPAACRAVVLAGPKAPLFPGEVAALAAHLRRGGGLVLYVDPGVDPGVGDLLGGAGLSLGAGTISDPRGEGLGPGMVAPARFGSHEATWPMAGAQGAPLYFDGARPVEAAAERGTVLLESAPESWAGPSPGEKFEPGRDRKGPLPLAAAGTTGSGRVAAVGDADVVSNRYLRFPGNRLFALGVLKWAAGEEKPIVLKPHGWRHGRLTWTEARRRIVRIVTQGILPGLALFIAIYLWRTRRRL